MRIQNVFQSLPKRWVRFIGFSAIFIVAIADYFSGSYISFTMFYLVPISFLSWYDGKKNGIAASFLSAIFWTLADLAWKPEMPLIIESWNGFNRLVIFLSISVMTDFIQTSFDTRLKRQEEKYHRLVETAVEGIIVLDAHGQINFVNSQAASMFACTKEYLLTQSLPSFIKDVDSYQSLKSILNVTDAGTASSEIQFVSATGSRFWTIVKAIPSSNGNGISENKILLLINITERKLAEANLSQKYFEVSAIQTLSSVLVQSLKLETRLQSALLTVLRITKFDAGAAFLFDQESEEFLFQLSEGLFSSEIEKMQLTKFIQTSFGNAGKNGLILNSHDVQAFRTGESDYYSIEGYSAYAIVPLVSKNKLLGMIVLLKKELSQVLPDTQMILRIFGEQIGIAVENARMYEDAKKREGQIRQLSVDLVRVQEDERKRFSRELHDGLSQILTTLKIKAEIALRHLQDASAESSQHLQQVIALADEAQLEAKQIAYDLRPSVLDDFGLYTAILHQTKNFEQRTNISVELLLPSRQPKIDPIIETTVYRIVQELLTNIAKHAQANKVVVQLLTRKNILTISVSDNGIGFDHHFDEKVIFDKSHQGLRNIRERVQILDGTFHIESQPAKGSEMMMEIPLHHEFSSVHNIMEVQE